MGLSPENQNRSILIDKFGDGVVFRLQKIRVSSGELSDLMDAARAQEREAIVQSVSPAYQLNRARLIRTIGEFTPCTATDGLPCCEACHCSRLADRILALRDEITAPEDVARARAGMSGDELRAACMAALPRDPRDERIAALEAIIRPVANLYGTKAPHVVIGRTVRDAHFALTSSKQEA